MGFNGKSNLNYTTPFVIKEINTNCLVKLWILLIMFGLKTEILKAQMDGDKTFDVINKTAVGCFTLKIHKFCLVYDNINKLCTNTDYNYKYNQVPLKVTVNLNCPANYHLQVTNISYSIPKSKGLTSFCLYDPIGGCIKDKVGNLTICDCCKQPPKSKQCFKAAEKIDFNIAKNICENPHIEQRQNCTLLMPHKYFKKDDGLEFECDKPIGICKSRWVIVNYKCTSLFPVTKAPTTTQPETELLITTAVAQKQHSHLELMVLRILAVIFITIIIIAIIVGVVVIIYCVRKKKRLAPKQKQLSLIGRASTRSTTNHYADIDYMTVGSGGGNSYNTDPKIIITSPSGHITDNTAHQIAENVFYDSVLSSSVSTEGGNPRSRLSSHKYIEITELNGSSSSSTSQQDENQKKQVQFNTPNPKVLLHQKVSNDVGQSMGVYETLPEDSITTGQDERSDTNNGASHLHNVDNGDNMIDNNYYETKNTYKAVNKGNNNAEDNQMLSNNGYNGGDLSEAGPMISNNYYDSSDLSQNVPMINNNYYDSNDIGENNDMIDNINQTTENEMVENKYYDGGNIGKKKRESTENILGNRLPPHPLSRAAPFDQNDALNSTTSVYAETYGHFPREGRQRQPNNKHPRE